MTTVDDYILTFSKDVQREMERIRSAIKQHAPDAEESISYGMPAYKLDGKPLVYFAGFKKHIGFYATPMGHKEFAEELSNYKLGKGSVQFPLNKPLPLDLIARMVAYKRSRTM